MRLQKENNLNITIGRSCAVHARGFTLLEIMVVLAIVGILAAIAYPSYLGAVRKAKRAEGRAALMQLMQQQERYYSQNTSYISFSSASTDIREKQFKWYSGDQEASSAYEISGQACDGETINNCVMLTAMPGTAKVNAAFTDEACQSLILLSTGEKKVSGPATDCWK